MYKKFLWKVGLFEFKIHPVIATTLANAYANWRTHALTGVKTILTNPPLESNNVGLICG